MADLDKYIKSSSYKMMNSNNKVAFLLHIGLDPTVSVPGLSNATYIVLLINNKRPCSLMV